MTYYDVLGLPNTASFDQIRASYREQIKFFHPDVFQGNPVVANAKTVQLNQAYDILHDPAKRQAYDLSLRKEPQSTQQGSSAYKTAYQEERARDTDPYAAYWRDEEQQVYNYRHTYPVATFFAWLAVAGFIALFAFSVAPRKSENAKMPLAPSPPPISNVKTTVPPNATILYSYDSFGEWIAPFTVETKSKGYYYVKLRDVQTEKDILVFFVHGGKTVTLDVPLGNYELLYAHGQTWYGTKELFGEKTVYSKADDTFSFYEDNGSVSGWTVELYLQSDGNLSIDQISPNEF